MRLCGGNCFLFRWIQRWFEVEDRVLYCYDAQEQDGSKVKRAAVLYQASVKVRFTRPDQTIPYVATAASWYSPARHGKGTHRAANA